MKNIKTDELLFVRYILTQIMENDNLTRDTSFVRVKNYITNLYCDKVLEEQKSKSIKL